MSISHPKFRVWERKREGYEKLRYETPDRHEAFSALRQLSRPESFAYIMDCRGQKPVFLVGVLDCRVIKDDVRLFVRSLFR